MSEPGSTSTTSTTDADQRGSSRLISASMIMAAGTMTSRVLGFGRLMLLVFLFGNGTQQADMFTFANTVPNSMYILLAGGVLNTVLVPQIVRAIKGDADGGEAYTNRIMTAGLSALAIITVVLTIAAPLVIYVYTPDSWRDPSLAAQYDSTVVLAYYCLPQIFFYGVHVLAGQVLNARERFGPMMWAPIANNVISIVVLAMFYVVFGQGDGRSAFTTREELVLGLGSTLGIVAQAAVLVPFLRSAGYHFRPRFDLRHTGLGKTFRLAKWTIGFVLVNQLALVVVNRLAGSATAGSEGAGLSTYYYAYAVWILPHSLITVSLATAMLPAASRYAAAHDMEGVAAETMRALRLALTALLPAAVAFIALGIPVSRLIFGLGRGAGDADFVGWTLMTLAIGLVPFTVQYICLRAFYALEDNRTTFFLQIVIAAANVGIGIAVVTLLDRPSLVAAGLGLAYSLAYVIGVLLSFRVLRRRLPTLSSAVLVRHGARLLLAVAPAGVAAAGITWAFTFVSDGAGIKILALGVAGLVALGIFFGLARVLHIDEVTQIVATVLRRRRSTPPADGAESGPDEAGVTGDSTALIEAVSPTIGGAPPVAGIPTGDESTENTEPHVMQPAALQRTESDDPDLGAGSGDRRLPHLAAGSVLAQRYRLEELLADAEPTLTWRAFDQVLSRSVLIHLLPPDDPRAPELLDAARRAAAATDSRFLRVLDAVEDGDDGVGSYIVCEYAVGQSLEVILSHGPLSGLEAGWVVQEVADALSGVHTLGLHHQRINPDTVIITPTGNVKIVGLLIESTLRPRRDGADQARDPEHDDVTDLGRLLYAALVARWPGGPAYGLPDAPAASHGWMTPRQVRAGVSPALDQVCDQILGHPPRHRAEPIATANDVVNALTKVLGPADASGDLERRLRQPIPLVGGIAPISPLLDANTEPMDAVELPVSRSTATSSASSPPSPSRTSAHLEADTPTVIRNPPPPVTARKTPRPPRRHRRWIAVLIGLVALALIATMIWTVLAQGRRTSGGEADPGRPASSTSASTAPPQALAIASARDFDPQGDDRTENPDEVRFAYDGDPETRWRTVNYYGSANLGNIKRGVGLVVDLGTAQPVSSVTVSLSGTGTTVQARVPGQNPATVSQPPMRSDSQWRTVSERAKAGKTATLTFEETVTTRYVLVYLTSLPKEGDGYRGGIYEVEVFS